MSSFNKVVLVGHLGGDPIIRDLENQIKVADIILATNEVYTRNGETREITDWHDIVAWRKLAEFSEKNLHKGKKILVEGKLRTNTWEDKESGKKRKSTYILAETIRFMERKEKPLSDLASFHLESETMEMDSLHNFEDEEDGDSLYPEIRDINSEEGSEHFLETPEKKGRRKKEKNPSFESSKEINGTLNSEFPKSKEENLPESVPF